MTNQQHSIIPTTELVELWVDLLEVCSDLDVFSLIAQWGADQELEACIDWIANARNSGMGWDIATSLSGDLRTARRPSPPSLKEQGLTAMELLKLRTTDPNIIEPLSRALEALPDA